MVNQPHFALVTGGAGGLGREISLALADRGASVAVSYTRAPDRAFALVDEIKASGVAALAVKLDLADPSSIDKAIKEVADGLGGLSVVVNNAAIASGGHSIPKGDLAAFSPDIWDELMTVNLRGPYLVSRAALPYLRASGQGRIINLGSTISHGAWGSDAIYAPSKGAVEPMTRFLAAALAPGITVNMIAPGLMEGTDMSGGAPQAYIEQWKDRAVLQRTTSAKDVARLVVSIVETSSMTGQTIIVDGGIHFG